MYYVGVLLPSATEKTEEAAFLFGGGVGLILFLLADRDKGLEGVGGAEGE